MREEITLDSVRALIEELTQDIGGARDKGFLKPATRSHLHSYYRVSQSETIENALNLFFTPLAKEL